MHMYMYMYMYMYMLYMHNTTCSQHNVNCPIV